MKKQSENKKYIVAIGNNGNKYVLKESVERIPHMTNGNSKTGKCGNFNFPIEYTCNHSCNCYKNKECYACHGCYNFTSNQALYSENYNFYKNASNDEFITFVNWYIETEKLSLVRYFTIGDIPDERFIDCINAIAWYNPNVKFWLYTKKYNLVNNWIDKHGFPEENLTIIFSHWLNDDGTYFPMKNPHNLPTSEFIPLGKEQLAESVTHICPCSNPNVKATCETCDHPCYTLKHGESMALLEHSTKRTKTRDKAIKEAHDRL